MRRNPWRPCPTQRTPHNGPSPPPPRAAPRQPPLMQVRDNPGSAARQYQLAKRAQDLGWPASLVVVIDQDQGRSGAARTGRDGFEYLIAEVGLGRAGAVLC